MVYVLKQTSALDMERAVTRLTGSPAADQMMRQLVFWDDKRLIPPLVLRIANAGLLVLKPFGGHASSGMSTCLMRPLGWMSTCRSGPAPELTNLCGTPAGTTTIWPPVTSIVTSPTVKVASPSCTTNTSS